jgi:hypothetical protein
MNLPRNGLDLQKIKKVHLFKLQWRIPDVIITDNRYRVSGDEALIMCHARISSGVP